MHSAPNFVCLHLIANLRHSLEAEIRSNRHAPMKSLLEAFLQIVHCQDDAGHAEHESAQTQANYGRQPDVPTPKEKWQVEIVQTLVQPALNS